MQDDIELSNTYERQSREIDKMTLTERQSYLKLYFRSNRLIMMTSTQVNAGSNQFLEMVLVQNM